ncbi:type-1 restriction enzyme EcoEI specificity protein [Aliivibrio wodanis]|uniref:Type-1 restriction enzyme EcoEI specificity protein n=1 Tax=Aliivibrio wodanis TaxID=80852 RepID=A0A090I5Y9_9GAMM|nr:type-1 restriction enzyme EcoEI specificity protein [Aliivibrio wodanis]
MSVERLITDNIDVWTSTVKTKSASGRGSSKKIDLYGIKKLRELILELAVRGKLVPQDPTDEPASVLLERIREERRAEAKNGKLNILKPISDSEFPCQLPINWTFVRLEEIIQISSGKNLTAKKMDSSGEIPVYGGNGVTGFHSEWNVSKKTIVIGRVGFYCGSVHLTPDSAWVTDNAFITKYSNTNLEEGFLVWLLKATNLNENDSATAQPVISGRKVYPIVIALPPKKEQQLIVEKVDELMSLCDQLEQQTETSIEAHQTLVEVLLNTLTSSADAQELMQNWQRISEHFDALFTTEKSIDTLKKTILQLAVMGKLVPQDLTDEPAAKLLERIAEEKAQLIKDKKIKKQKALSEITEDEKPFALPSGWEWERIGNLSHFIEYGSSQKTVESLPNGVPVLKMGDIQNGKLILGEHKVMSSDVDELPNLYVKNNDVLYNRTNSAELVGKTGIFKGVDDKYSFASYLIRIRCNQESIFPDYLNLSMNTPQFRISQIEPHIKKQCGQANVNGTLMKSMLVSLPPLKEQKRIFNKVNELIMMCDQLKASLKESQTTQLHLTDAIIDKAL